MKKKSAKEEFISNKIRTIMHEGVHGKKVDVKQAAAIAYSYARRKNK